MNVLESLSDALAAVVERAGATVVRIEGRRGAPGSGIVWSADGTILTAEHVLERDDDITVGLADGKVVSGAVVGRDSTTDVAVLRAEATGLATPEWRGPEGIGTGHVAVVLSRPGNAVRAQLGIISAAAPSWRTPAGGELAAYLQPDVGPSWGFSGGLLVDASGKAIGMTTSGILRRTPLAIPAPTLERVARMLLTQGRVPRGYLGIAAYPVRLPKEIREQLGQGRGLIVIGVDPGSPAEQAGLVLGDVVTAIEGAAVRHHGDVAARLGPEIVGKVVSLRIVRAGVPQDLRVTVRERGPAA
ncbi:MAG TPA: trypsin-like peptidase domain-containing protein [bacterium]|nr:trypsin-like peptidase domain-containing protein [bacterium]